MLSEFETQIRVRYDEADPMGFVHHANYFRYFELGRTEMLRAAGSSYRQMEATGLMIVVVQADVNFRRPAHYDDLLTVRTRVSGVRRARIEHEYVILRGAEELAQARMTLAVLDRHGKVCKVPEWLRSVPISPLEMSTKSTNGKAS